MTDEHTILFKIFRFNPEKDNRPYYQDFMVPIHRGMTILDGLHNIKQNMDNSLAWRYSCRMGVCGSCAMLVNGKPMLACNTQITDISNRAVTIAPLPNFDVIRDLVPDLSPMFQHHLSTQPQIHRDDHEEMALPTGEYGQSPEELEKYLQFSFCIRCGACMAACPTMATDREYLGPMPLAQAFRYSSDTRDENGFEIRKEVLDSSHGVYRCHFGSECSIVCPKGVDPAKAIQLMKRMLVFDYLKLLKKKPPCRIITEPRETGKREGIPEAPPFTVNKE